EDRAAFHHQWRPRMMAQYEDRRMVGRVWPPPAAPAFIRPWPAHGAKHIPSQDPGAKILHPAAGKIVIQAQAALPSAVHGLERVGREKPLVQFFATLTKRVFKALLRPGTKTIHADRKTRHSQLAHCNLSD